jgi:transaldolase/glucose-6-phosphate isomerase
MWLGPTLDAALVAALEVWRDEDRMGQLWRRDAALWTGADEARWLGWLTLADAPVDLDSAATLAGELRAEGVTALLLLGMGGSSLAPEVLSRVLGAADGSPTLHVLDSTDPAQVRRVETDLDLTRTLCIVSSKSGTTLEPTLLTEYFLDRMASAVGPARTGSRFLAITDPGSRLESFAAERRFRAVLHGVPTVGGRFSALSNFGLVPAALTGVDVWSLLGRARAMRQTCGPDVALHQNPGARLGLVLGIAAKHGRDKVTLILSPAIEALAGWLEQLLAESTGKAGHGLIPVAEEQLAAPDLYGDDRLFVVLRLEGAAEPDQTSVNALVDAGHPVIELTLEDPLDVGGEFFRWEVATAVCGAVLGVNPFDQPDVEASKVETRELADAYERGLPLPAEAPLATHDGLSLFADPATSARLQEQAGLEARLEDLMAAHLDRLGPGDYLALLAYMDMAEANQAVLQRIRHAVRERRGVATSVGFGPRFLHSTGQAFKGGPDSGVFLQVTCDDPVDVPIPGRRVTFGVVKAAQALGDQRVLTQRQRRALRVHLSGDVRAGLDRLEQLVLASLA